MNGCRAGRRAGGRATVVLAVAAVLVAALLVFPGAVPNAVGRVGSLLETFLPWLGLAVPVLLALAARRRSAVALGAALVPLAAWCVLFAVPSLTHTDRPYDLTAVQHNVDDANPDPSGTARALLRARPDVIALEELTPAALPEYARALAAEYPHHATAGTVGLWSRHPLSDVRPLDIKPEGIPAGWQRGLRATARTPHGEVAVYVAHLPSVRIGAGGLRSAWRDESAGLLGAALDAEPLDRVILLGDLNGTLDDRGLRPVTAHVTGPRSRFAFSWPETFPLARIDHVLTREATVTDVWTLPATGSDHLPIGSRIRL
ncbi:endonuclease/exonuclease/phosphatase family protein [Streptomyces purpureus]|uniref:endonuclease/exonuclease/phosphatase family protein n=1 Tax=Streptomyces purpureus TaxID=1951 RepID=UPI001E294102|nr:endonuclease/exonuclease/phosphatase family protein [Streptomyces purpureus]